MTTSPETTAEGYGFWCFDCEAPMLRLRGANAATDLCGCLPGCCYYWVARHPRCESLPSVRGGG